MACRPDRVGGVDGALIPHRATGARPPDNSVGLPQSGSIVMSELDGG
jgi:hypothetical protein